MTLRSLTTIAAATLATIAIVAALALSWTTTQMHALTTGITGDLDGVRAAEEIDKHLLRHEQAATMAALGDDRRAADEAEAAVRRWYDAAQGAVNSPQEAEIVASLAEDLERYFARYHALASQATDVSALSTLRPLLKASHADVEALLHINLAQSNNAAARSRYWDRAADQLGVAIALALILVVAAIIVAAQLFVARPLFRLRDAIATFGGGAPETRTLERGPGEVREIARVFNDMADALERQRQNRLEFIAGVAHDLRNPLGALKLALRTVAADAPQAPADRLGGTMRMMARQVDVLNTMISDLLDAARIEAGRLDLEVGEHDLCDIAAHAVDLFRNVSMRHELTVECRPAAVVARCDPARIEQVLNNLISNAIKYSPAGGRVHVRVGVDDAKAILAVADEGLGIEPAEVERIFEPFRRSGSSRSAIPGVGLGLSVTRRIVEAHGGTVMVQSTPGKGSTFTVRIPACVPSVVAMRLREGA